jgi:hypothetical protein
LAKQSRKEDEQRKQQEIKEGKRMPNGHELRCKCTPCQLMRLNFNVMVQRNSILDLNNRLTAAELKLGIKEVPKVEQPAVVHDPTQPCDHAVHGQEPPVQEAVREEGDPAGAPTK